MCGEAVAFGPALPKKMRTDWPTEARMGNCVVRAPRAPFRTKYWGVSAMSLSWSRVRTALAASGLGAGPAAVSAASCAALAAGAAAMVCAMLGAGAVAGAEV